MMPKTITKEYLLYNIPNSRIPIYTAPAIPLVIRLRQLNIEISLNRDEFF